MQLIEIEESGRTSETIEQHEMLDAVFPATLALYTQTGFTRPWISYVAVEGNRPVGTCAFKSPPQENRVEIAYFTFPEYEGLGIGTWMAAELISMAGYADPDIVVTAQTLPRENASTSILKKLGFLLAGSLEHPEDGTVWEWRHQHL